eukprot:gene15817-21936_t
MLPFRSLWLLVVVVCLLVGCSFADDGFCTAPPKGSEPDPSSCGGGEDAIEYEDDLSYGGIDPYEDHLGEDDYQEYSGDDGMDFYDITVELKPGLVLWESKTGATQVRHRGLLDKTKFDSHTAVHPKGLLDKTEFDSSYTGLSPDGLLDKTEFDSSYTGLSPDGARWLIANRPRVKMVGIDYVS